MFDLDAEVRSWREHQERTSSLSPRELDELEDHLKALVDLEELELNAALAPTRAFAIARRELGEPAALSREFAKVGKLRWRRWLVAGWTMNVASWFLPAVPLKLFGVVHIMYGHELFLDAELLILVVPFNLCDVDDRSGALGCAHLQRSLAASPPRIRGCIRPRGHGHGA